MNDRKEIIQEQRAMMKSNFNQFDQIETDQQKKMPYPALGKEVAEGEEVIGLPPVDVNDVNTKTIYDGIIDRVSHRKHSEQPLSLKELGFLLYSTQGVKRFKEGKFSFRTVPSGGARHAFETYMVVNDVEGLKKGLYRYQPFTHELILMREDDTIDVTLVDGVNGQKFAGTAAVTFIWSCVPYRMEWRYDIASHKTMLLDAGHVCQNLYLACETIEAGTCAIAAYNQEKMDTLIGADGEDEFVVYIAPVGKKPE